MHASVIRSDFPHLESKKKQQALRKEAWVITHYKRIGTKKKREQRLKTTERTIICKRKDVNNSITTT